MALILSFTIGSFCGNFKWNLVQDVLQFYYWKRNKNGYNHLPSLFIDLLLSQVQFVERVNENRSCGTFNVCECKVWGDPTADIRRKKKRLWTDPPPPPTPWGS